MKTNYHTHTYRCGHAIGNESQMIEAAIKQKYNILGMSCHIPLPYYRLHTLCSYHLIKNFRDFKNTTKKVISNGPNMRMTYKDSKVHLNIIKQLKIKYQDQITIYQGYEAEYLPDYLNYYQKILNDGTVDYLILGNHFDNRLVESTYYGRVLNDKKVARYATSVCKAMDSNLFSYIAHPDLYMNRTPIFNDACYKAALDIATKAKETNTPLEINGGGMRAGKSTIGSVYRYRYPIDDFWKVVGEIGAPVIIGIDAHSPADFDDNDYQDLVQYSKQFNLQLIDVLPFKKGKKDSE